MDSFPDITPLLQSWVVLQTWAVRFFIFLGVITLFPWILLVLFDAGLYIWRYLILAPTTRFLYPNAYSPENPVVLEDDEVECVSTVITGTVRMKRRRVLETGARESKEGPDWLDEAWRKKDVS